ncbi:MAG: exodeoxyribonuclease V subunit gamma [bacterium]|nr:exodeoxyribonuclease V subunit gamma [bacterium]
MALFLHVRSHPDDLVGVLCDLLEQPPPDPFGPDLVAVPTRGIERWITQRIASEMGQRVGSGICANLEFPSPRRLLREVWLEVPDLARSIEAWEGTALTRHILTVLDEHRDESWMGLLARYLEGGMVEPSENSRRLRAARKISGLISHYSIWRPEMVRAWRSGEDRGPDGGPIPADQLWQPRLWRLVRNRIDVPTMPELLPEALAPIREGSIRPVLPERLGIYGLTTAHPRDLELWETLAEVRDVHLYLLHPSPVLWNRTVGRLGREKNRARTLRSDDPTADLAEHPLLISWAQESREFQAVLGGWPGLSGADSQTTAESESVPAHLLGQLQADIRLNRLPTSIDAPAEGDRSIQIHVCHGDRRQVEVTRDAILHLLSSDPTLEPRDVVIMTPDLATFAPLMEASFLGSVSSDQDENLLEGDLLEASGDPLPDLRVRIADRAPSATNPLVRFAATVLEMAGSRIEAGEVRELIAMSVVRRLFGIDEEASDALASMIEDVNISWGLDADHRRSWEAGDHDDQTWRRGLDRALAGVFYSDDPVRVVGSMAPLEGVEGGEADTAGLLAQLLDRVGTVVDLLSVSRPHSEWGRAIATSVGLLAAPAWDEQWQWRQLERLLEESFPPPDASGVDPVIGPVEARLVIDRWANEKPSPLHFRTGDTTVCTLAPMRSVPYRVICLLGMDDQRFPRTGRSDGDDLLADHELIGDRDRSAEDRQLMLDALMAAGDHLVITYSGRDQMTNAEYPPAVPVAELQDVLSQMLGRAGLEKITYHHPLQPFSPRNFIAGEMGLPGPWGFDPLQMKGSEAVLQRPNQALDRAPLTISAPDIEEIRLDDFIAFLEHPGRGFIRARLGFRIPDLGEIDDDTVATKLDPLGKWGVTDRLLKGLLEGFELDELISRERATDSLPPGNLGEPGLMAARSQAENLMRAAQEIGHDLSRYRQYTGTIKVDGKLLEGSLHADPTTARIELITPSRLKGKHRLRAYVQMLFLSVLEPSKPWYAVLIGRAPTQKTEWMVSFQPLGQTEEQRLEKAEHLLSELLKIYEEGLSAPIPLPIETAYIWQRKLGNDRGAAFNEARKQWEPDTYRYGTEADDPSYKLLFSELALTQDLLESGFQDYARRLWGPILPLLREKQV